MSSRKIVSTLDVTNWFCKKAEKVTQTLTEAKIQHLLFLAQIHFGLKEGRLLMPSLFVCGASGFYEPTIRDVMKFSLPLMSKPNLSAKTEDFLELIWMKYASLSQNELDKFIFSLECWKHFYRPEEETIVDPLQLVDSFAESIHNKIQPKSLQKSKILISQNGPVKVSAWHPRKLDSSKNKENIPHE